MPKTIEQLQAALAREMDYFKRNERGAGRKRKATPQMIARVAELRSRGLSQQSITKTVSVKYGVPISRTTVGEIVRGKHGAILG